MRCSCLRRAQTVSDLHANRANPVYSDQKLPETERAAGEALHLNPLNEQVMVSAASLLERGVLIQPGRVDPPFPLHPERQTGATAQAHPTLDHPLEWRAERKEARAGCSGSER